MCIISTCIIMYNTTPHRTPSSISKFPPSSLLEPWRAQFLQASFRHRSSSFVSTLSWFFFLNAFFFDLLSPASATTFPPSSPKDEFLFFCPLVIKFFLDFSLLCIHISSCIFLQLQREHASNIYSIHAQSVPIHYVQKRNYFDTLPAKSSSRLLVLPFHLWYLSTRESPRNVVL